MKTRITEWLAAAVAVAAVVVGWAGPAAASSTGSQAVWYGYYYQNVSNWHSGQCLSATGARGKSQVEQYPCGADTYQQWRTVYTDSGWFELIVASTGECLEVGSASLDNNHKVVKNTCTGAYNQQWTTLTTPIGGGFVMLEARHSGKCLAILSESLEPGADMVQYTCPGRMVDPIGGSYWSFT